MLMAKHTNVIIVEIYFYSTESRVYLIGTTNRLACNWKVHF